MDQSDGGVRVTFKAHLGNGRAGHKRIRKGRSPRKPKEDAPPIPRIARLLALAHHFDDLIRDGIVRDYAEIARLMGVSRAHVTHIMDLLFLAPDIQEEILFSTAGPEGGTGVSSKHIRRVVAEAEGTSSGTPGRTYTRLQCSSARRCGTRSPPWRRASQTTGSFATWSKAAPSGACTVSPSTRKARGTD